MWGYLLFIGSPVLGTALGAAFARGWFRTYALFGLGLLVGLGVVLLAYLTSPPDYQHSNGTEGEQYLGRWWDPAFVVTLTAIGYCLYLLGLGLGAFVRGLFGLLRGRGQPRAHGQLTGPRSLVHLL